MHSLPIMTATRYLRRLHAGRKLPVAVEAEDGGLLRSYDLRLGIRSNFQCRTGLTLNAELRQYLEIQDVIQ
jgi:hypothetical protein